MFRLPLIPFVEQFSHPPRRTIADTGYGSDENLT